MKSEIITRYMNHTKDCKSNDKTEFSAVELLQKGETLNNLSGTKDRIAQIKESLCTCGLEEAKREVEKIITTIQAMNGILTPNQFLILARDWSKGCNCNEEERLGETWCCNNCGRPTVLDQ